MIRNWQSKLWSWLVGYNQLTHPQPSPEIPTEIGNNERIVRVLFYPKHFKKEQIYSYAFRSPADYDEVSVIRIDFCDENFCKGQGLSMQEESNPYYGLGVLSANQIRSIDADVVYTPEHHDFHADIKVGHVFVAGEPPPPKIKFKIDELARMAHVYKDSSPTEFKWCDGEIQYLE